MESIRENRPLMISLVGTYSFIVFLALGWSSDLCEQFGIVQFPEEVFMYNFWSQAIAIIAYKNVRHSDKILSIFQNIFSFSVSVHIVASADVGFHDVASSRQNMLLPTWRRKASTTKMIFGLFNLFQIFHLFW